MSVQECATIECLFDEYTNNWNGHVYYDGKTLIINGAQCDISYKNERYIKHKIQQLILKSNKSIFGFGTERPAHVDENYYVCTKISFYDQFKSIFDFSDMGKISINLSENNLSNNCEYVETNVDDKEIKDVTGLKNVYQLNSTKDIEIKDVNSLESLGPVHSLDLSACQNIVDVSSLGPVHSLDLTDMPRYVCDGKVDDE